MKDILPKIIVGLILFGVIAEGIADHVRLIQVRQQLMDKGTPIEMDAK